MNVKRWQISSSNPEQRRWSSRAKTLVEAVEEHIANNMMNASMPILASISAVDFDNVNWGDIDAALKSIQYDFAKKFDDSGERRTFCSDGRHRLLVENTDQLVKNYNRILGNVRKFFPDFSKVKKDHNPIFGEDVMVSCFLRKCEDNDLDLWLQEIGERHPRETNLDEEMNEYYDKRIHEDTTEEKAKYIRSIEYGLASLSPGLRVLLYFQSYIGENYIHINKFLRKNIKNSTDFTLFAPNLAIPFYADKEYIVYRGDGMKFSPDTLKIKGFYSTALTLDDAIQWSKNDGRIMRIIVPKGTPFLLLILHKPEECEFTLLPGTQLEKVYDTGFQVGHFVEYRVAGNPPLLSESEEANIVRNSLSNYDLGNSDLIGRKKKKTLSPTEGGPTLEEIHQFNVNLVNRLY